MKRCFLFVICSLCVFSFTFAAENRFFVEVPDFDIVVAGQICDKDKPLVSEWETWFVPFRMTCEKLGIPKDNISWNKNAKVASLKDNSAIITVAADSDIVEVNTVEVKLGKAPMLYNGTLYVPVDFFENVLKCKAVRDEPKGIMYLQREEEYNLIYDMLSECVSVDLESNNKVNCDYISRSEMRDDKNEYLISEQKETGFFEYDLKTGECIDEGSYTRWGRTFSYKDHCKLNVLYKTFMGETERITNLKEVNSFTEEILNNAYLTRVNKKIENLSIVDVDANANGLSLSELEKLALVLKTKKYPNRDAVMIYGSLLGIQKVLNAPGIIDEQIAYMIDIKTGRLLQIGGKSIVRSLVYGISVRQTSEWSYFYNVE